MLFNIFLYFVSFIAADTPSASSCYAKYDGQNFYAKFTSASQCDTSMVHLLRDVINAIIYNCVTENHKLNPGNNLDSIV